MNSRAKKSPLGGLLVAEVAPGTGSNPTMKTIGMVVVAALAASAAGGPAATMSETRCLTNSSANAGNLPYCPSAK